MSEREREAWKVYNDVRTPTEMARELTYVEKMRALDMQAFQEAERKKKKEAEQVGLKAHE